MVDNFQMVYLQSGVSTHLNILLTDARKPFFFLSARVWLLESSVDFAKKTLSSPLSSSFFF